MSNKEVYEEIYNDYINSERGKQDFQEISRLDPFDAMEGILKRLLPDSWRDYMDEFCDLICASQEFGFFCGMREAGRHLMLTEVER